MRCFNHDQENAVSLCFMCHKGLCRTCHKEYLNLSSCGSESCEKSMTTVSKAYTMVNANSNNLVSFIMLLAGICFVVIGFKGYFYDGGDLAILNLGIMFLGIVFIIPMIKTLFTYLRGKR